jgi:hypothetical protein
MSAFMVNSDTLDLLASVATLYDTQFTTYVYLDDNQAGPTQGLKLITDVYGRRYVEIRSGDEDNIVRELWHANRVSLEARYEDPTGLIHDDLIKDTWRPIYDVLPAKILGAIACYEYQACESDTWRYSFAWAYCQTIRRKVCAIISDGFWEFNLPDNYVRPISLMSMIRDPQ